jgi:PST family polysaccharide transporter
MARFGRLVTGANLLNYIFRNADNVLIGWRFGPESLGLYQKAYGLLLLPINQVNGPIGNVATVTLSRLQSDPERLRRYFIGGYTVIASLVLPIVTGATLFSSDIIRFVLGEKWTAATPIFQFLAPAALLGALQNPLGWLYISLGRADRQLRCAAVWCSLVVAAFVVGLKYGPEGVAIAYSGISIVLALPLCLYGLHGTPVRLRDLGQAMLRPVLAVVIAGSAMWLLKLTLPADRPAAIGAIGGCLGLVALYAFLLLVVFRQWSLYRDLVPHLFQRRKTAPA